MTKVADELLVLFLLFVPTVANAGGKKLDVDRLKKEAGIADSPKP